MRQTLSLAFIRTQAAIERQDYYVARLGNISVGDATSTAGSRAESGKVRLMHAVRDWGPERACNYPCIFGTGVCLPLKRVRTFADGGEMAHRFAILPP